MSSRYSSKLSNTDAVGTPETSIDVSQNCASSPRRIAPAMRALPALSVPACAWEPSERSFPILRAASPAGDLFTRLRIELLRFLEEYRQDLLVDNRRNLHSGSSTTLGAARAVLGRCSCAVSVTVSEGVCHADADTCRRRETERSQNCDSNRRWFWCPLSGATLRLTELRDQKSARSVYTSQGSR